MLLRYARLYVVCMQRISGKPYEHAVGTFKPLKVELFDTHQSLACLVLEVPTACV